MPSAAILIVPYVPVTLAPTEPEALADVPATTPVIVFVSPASTSVSFVSTLPVGFVPAVPLAVPPASTAAAVSETVTGPSLMFVREIVSVRSSVRLF